MRLIIRREDMFDGIIKILKVLVSLIIVSARGLNLPRK